MCDAAIAQHWGGDMRQIATTITQLNQVTIPAEVRRLLGLKPKDKVTFTIDDGGRVHLTPSAFSLETAFGSVAPSGRETAAFKQAIRDAKDEKAEDPVRRLRKALQ